jgi:hypothetical protein
MNGMTDPTLSIVQATPSTEARLSLRALFLLTTFAAVAAAVFGVILRTLRSSAQWKLVIFAAVSVLVLLGTAVGLGWLRRRAEKKAGAVLVQLSPHSYFLPRAPRVTAFIMGGLLLAAGSIVWLFGAVAIVLEELPQNRAESFPAYIVILPQFLILAGQSNLLIAVGMATIWWNRRVRLCAHGIVRRQEFVPWDNVSRHIWDAVYRDVLVIYWGVHVVTTSAIEETTGEKMRLKLRRYPPSGHVAMRVPAEERGAVTALLQEKLLARNLAATKQ